LRLLIGGGRVIDPGQGIDAKLDVLIEDGRIAEVGHKLPVPRDCQVYEAQGRIVAPGLIDMHTHLREPGREDQETISSGTRAAVWGGFTSVVCMPNTQPPNDNQAVTKFILEQARTEGACHVFPVGCITKGQQGEELAEMGELAASGVVGFSDDGRSVANAELLRRAMEYAAMLDLPIISHCQDAHLGHQGVMHEGLISTKLGLPGMPSAAEEIIVARDIRLAELTGARLHIAHVSAAGSVDLIRQAKFRLADITAEVTPHHFTLTDEAVYSFDTNTKVNPPLRSKDDLEAILTGLEDETLGVIATDHAPHTLAEKEREFTLAPFGMVGLETALPLALQLVSKDLLTLPGVIARLTINPARILDLPHKGTLAVGSDADVTIINPEKKVIVDPGSFKSKGRNTPFGGWELQGAAEAVVVSGKLINLQ